jgi:DNA-binding PadR family transcriptional regulator
MPRKPKPPVAPTRATRRVLLALLSGASNLSGYPLARAAQVGYGKVYVILARLEREGWADSDWGPETAHGRRRFYRLTTRGRYYALRTLGLEDDHGE